MKTSGRKKKKIGGGTEGEEELEREKETERQSIYM